MRISPNVISLFTGAPLGDVPEYEDRRRRPVLVKIPLRTGETLEVHGEPTVFDFIIHYTIGLREADRRRHCGWNKWSITEPTTGLRIAHGASRGDALFDLAWSVALHGGAESFEALVGQAIKKHFEQHEPAVGQR